MSERRIESIDDTVQKTHIWLNEVAEELHTNDKHEAYLVLRAFLHALRDRLTVDEAAQLSAQLPTLIRGIYFEGWDPSRVPDRVRDRDAFLERVSKEAIVPPREIDPVRAVRACWQVLARHVSAGEIEDVRSSLPKAIRDLVES